MHAFVKDRFQSQRAAARLEFVGLEPEDRRLGIARDGLTTAAFERDDSKLDSRKHHRQHG
jgi:hypothetical protein